MKQPESSVTIRATLSSYIVLSGIWVVLSMGYWGLYFWKPGPGLINIALLTGGIAILWWCWLNGFRLTLSEVDLVYRDGFYRTNRIPLEDVKEHRFTWMKRKVLSRSFQTPILIVSSKHGNPAMLINPKPFSRAGLREIFDSFDKTSLGS